MDFGNFSNLVKCKNFKGTTVCIGETCNNYVPTQADGPVTCKTQRGKLTTEKLQYDKTGLIFEKDN